VVDRRDDLAEDPQVPRGQDVVAADHAAGERVLDREEPEVDRPARHPLADLLEVAAGDGLRRLAEEAAQRLVAVRAELALEGDPDRGGGRSAMGSVFTQGRVGGRRDAVKPPRRPPVTRRAAVAPARAQ
jgi:hypothetical protein